MLKRQNLSLNAKSNISFSKGKTTSHRNLNQSLRVRNESANQSVLSESTLHSLRNYGSVLPVLVIEAISSEISSRNAVSVKMTDCGWVWLVCGRRVFIWKFKRSSNERSSSCTCFELQLPPSDLSHKADLICMLQNTNNQIPGLIAVSPEGIVRYWPSIAYDGHSIETTVTDLQGQECFSLTNIQPLGCILGTTTSSLVHIAINSGDAGNIIVCRTLKVPQGMFSGFSRKVSSFIFGATPASHSAESRSLIKILKDTTSNDETFVYVLSSSLIQKWIILSPHSEALVMEYDLDRALRDAFLEFGVWNCETTHPNQLQLWQIDFEIRNENELLLLVAALNAEVSSQIYYALILIDTTGTTNRGPPLQLKSFTCLKNNPIFYSREDEERILNLKILNIPANNVLYVYSPRQVLCVQYENDVLDVINVNGNDDHILGAGVCDDTPILFTSKDGLVSLLTNENFTIAKPDTSSSECDVVTADDDNETILLKAFALYRKRDNVKCQYVITEHILKNPSSLDDVVVNVSLRLCDETPHSDPRWAEVEGTPSNMTVVSKLISDQLEEKFKAHESFIDFLKSSNVWDSLGEVVVNGVVISTQFLIYEHLEKLVFAIALKKLNDEFADIVNPAIKTLLERRGSIVQYRLTPQDIFYKEVTRTNELFSSLIELEEEEIGNSLSSSKHVLHIILNICKVLIICVQEVYKFRHKCQPLFEASCKKLTECNLWTISLTKSGIGSSLLRQFEILVDYGINAKFSGKSVFIEESIQTKNAVHQKLVDLVDVILQGHIYQLSCLERGTEKYRSVESTYESERSKLIEPLIAAKQYERAVSLAEKYEDFNILIRVCEEIDNKDRLQRYMTEFSNKGFSEYLFKWYMKQGQFSKLLSSTSNDLGSFLKGYKNLQWINEIGSDQFVDAAKSLKSLAASVDNDVPKKRTLLSLGKLCALADGQEIAGVLDDFSELETLPQI